MLGKHQVIGARTGRGDQAAIAVLLTLGKWAGTVKTLAAGHHVNQLALASLFRMRKTQHDLHLRKVPILHIAF